MFTFYFQVYKPYKLGSVAYSTLVGAGVLFSDLFNYHVPLCHFWGQLFEL